MQEGQLLMTQADRDRLVTLRKTKKRLITQRQAAEELRVSVRQVKRLVYALKKRGDKAVIHGLRGKPSNQRIAKTVEEEAIQILSADLYTGFGADAGLGIFGRPARHRGEQRDLAAMDDAGKAVACERTEGQGGTRLATASKPLWGTGTDRRRRLMVSLVLDKVVHAAAPEANTSEHDWLEGRGEKLYLIAMIDDATSRLFARFVRHDSTEENMKLLWSYVEKFGRPLAFYTDKASIFQTAEKRRRKDEWSGISGRHRIAW
jgi:hypothetical protein